MNAAVALRTLADHLDHHPHLADSVITVKPNPDGPLGIQVYGGAAAIPELLRWHATLGAPAFTAYTSRSGDVHLFLAGLATDLPVELVDVAVGAEAVLLRTNFALPGRKPGRPQIPVHHLRALVSAAAAERIERPIVDQHLVGGAR